MSHWKIKFKTLTSLTHTEQAKWWLNGFWKDGAKEEAENIWNTAHTFVELQTGQKVLYGRRAKEVKEGCDLDELQSHRILELLGGTMTVLALRKRLRELDIDSNKKMSLTEYLVDKYGKTPQEVVDSPQGKIDPIALKAAEEQIEAATNALNAAVDSLAASETASKEAEAAAAKASAALAEQQAAEEEVRKAEAEAKAAADSLHAQEEELKTKIDKAEKLANDDSLGVVKRGRARQEAEQLKSQDPLPLQKAKITQNASLKRVTKKKKAAEAKTAACTEVKNAADTAKDAATAALNKANSDKAAAQQAFKVAEDKLEDVKSAGDGVADGAIWWLDRQLSERKKFMPK